MTSYTGYGAQRVVEAIRRTLQAYLESQYHIKNESLIEERRKLLEEPGTVHQLPFVEATPTYQQIASYSDLQIPSVVRQLLTDCSELTKPDVGIYKSPYVHQGRALEEFFTKGRDLIVATGTGSGKTETFLMPILGSLAMEAAERPKAAALRGVRALILYPMNALVNDQLGRIRKLFGDSRVATRLREGRGRMATFGSYTSRTPYPGPRKPSKDALHIKPLFEDFYLKYIDDPEKVSELIAARRWPSKNLKGFYGADKEEKKKFRTAHNWPKRLITQPDDRELMTRDEIQRQCPDLLITNYSMLEYMLLRPIERSIFKATQQWLAADEHNQIILVLDEAHMYRGAGGAEVALLIRRFMARLGVPRKRVRCILTSASLGEGKEAEESVVRFACDLTGLPSAEAQRFALVKGEREKRSNRRPGTGDEARTLAALDLGSFQNFQLDGPASRTAIAAVAATLGWPAPPDNPSHLAQYLFDVLTGFGPAEELFGRVSGKAVELGVLAGQLFPHGTGEQAILATERLMALASFAQRKTDDRVLLPLRLHLFYRGLPGLFACVNQRCEARRDRARGEHDYILGKLHTQPRVHCQCEARGRVFELLTHRDCGAAVLRAFIRGTDGDFLWHEPTRAVGREQADPLVELHLLVEGSPHQKATAEVQETWIEISSGKLLRSDPRKKSGFLRAFVPTAPMTIESGRRVISFRRCPICLRRWRQGNSKIMDLATKGEAPFANLVKAQVINQPAKREESPQFPNGGRKSLLFSDGRQKAARLARDIPREVEYDSFRQAIALAATRLQSLGREPRLTQHLYKAFIAVVRDHHLHFFDRADQHQLRQDVKCFELDYAADLEVALSDWDVRPPPRYLEALLRQLCNTFYSIHASTVGFVRPSKETFRRLVQSAKANAPSLAEEEVRALSIGWIAELLSRCAFDPSMPSDSIRVRAMGHEGTWGSNGELPEPLPSILSQRLGLSAAQQEGLRDCLCRALCKANERGQLFLDPNTLCLDIDLGRPWFQCRACTSLDPVVLAGCCTNCGSADVSELKPDESEYVRARKSFWRVPIADCLAKKSVPRHITAEEHTAQLSQRDAGVIHATTEKYELRFQDVVIGTDDGPIDVLSCTTTMEVGVDIGSLVAVGLRNVPPQRENYQQRAGRAGRRGAAVSTVITYGQGGAHDSHYFNNPVDIVAGQPRKPAVKTDNPKIARRHIHSYLIQTFFHEALDHGMTTRASALIESSLGSAYDFLHGPPDAPLSFGAFKKWVEKRVIDESGDLREAIARWLPEGVSDEPEEWIRQTARALLAALEHLAPKVVAGGGEGEDNGNGEEEENIEKEKEKEIANGASQLLAFLFDEGLLPSYAFPTDLCSFIVEDRDPKRYDRVITKERPQQSIAKALSEYAPGRLIVIDKETYRSGGILASCPPTVVDRAEPLFRENLYEYTYCRSCSFVAEPSKGGAELVECPVCGDQIASSPMLIPQVFSPESGRAIDETDKDQEFTYATSAQFPVPAGADDIGAWRDIGTHGSLTQANDRRLVIVNKGRKGDDAGFSVCEKCGATAPTGTGQAARPQHDRPYLVQVQRGQQRPGRCSGTYRTVFLGHTFRSDLLLLRIHLRSPITVAMRSSEAREAIESALRTLSEALLLAASRVLDIDAAEFRAGFRIVPGVAKEERAADIYLFDTLSGGAGYSDQAANSIDEVLRETRLILEKCKKNCERSCYDCLRNYSNQYWHESLDRELGRALLAYMLDGTIPAIAPPSEQAARLVGLIRMFELEGLVCKTGASVRGTAVPLLVSNGSREVAIGTYHGLLDRNRPEFSHPLEALDDSPEPDVVLVNEFLLDRNLPIAYQQVRAHFGR